MDKWKRWEVSLEMFVADKVFSSECKSCLATRLSDRRSQEQQHQDSRPAMGISNLFPGGSAVMIGAGCRLQVL